MIRDVFHDHSTWNDVPFRFRGGHAAGSRSRSYWRKPFATCRPLGMDEVRAHERDLTQYAIEHLQTAGPTVDGPTVSRTRAAR